jgi:hypothetical protein
MFKKLRTTVLVLMLIFISALQYIIQNTIFHRPVEIWFYFFQDLAFVPFSVLLVSLGLNTVMIRHDRQTKMERVSVVINEFYAESGTDLMQTFRIIEWVESMRILHIKYPYLYSLAVRKCPFGKSNIIVN